MVIDERARRRVRAARLLLQGRKPAEVAQRVGAPRQTVYRWLDVLNADGIDALRVMRKGGRPAQLDEERHEQLRQILLTGPQAAGFGTDLWTLKRVRETIKRCFGVQYSEVHVWRLLGKLGFSSQKPQKRAKERDEAAIERWKKRTWPALKKSPGSKAV
jgi:transposase